jgi:hypothetical protein
MTRTATPPKPTKAATIEEMLRARRGASIAELGNATGWQDHSVRAALSGLRKAGYAVERRAPAKPGAAARYRITATPGSA